MYNAIFRGSDGLTPWHRRFDSEPEYQIYPFGALVLYKHPSDAPVPTQTAHGNTGPKSSTKKWRNRLVPSIFIGPTQGPGGQWAQSYQIVLLASILSSYRASRVSIRPVHDVIFPEVVSFPSRQKLKLQGAFEDLTLPSPHFSDDTEQWSIVTDEVGSADVLEYDGLLQENALRSEKTRIVETMMAIEPDLEEQVDVDVDATPAFGDGSPSNDFAAIEPDVAEAEEIGLQPTPAEPRNRL